MGEVSAWAAPHCPCPANCLPPHFVKEQTDFRLHAVLSWRCEETAIFDPELYFTELWTFIQACCELCTVQGGWLIIMPDHASSLEVIELK